MAHDVFSAIGNTPLVEIKALNPNPHVRILAKLDMMNPGGSVKDRAARYMIEAAERSGALKKGMVILEPTSGNTGIGLAMLGAARGYKVVLTMPESMSVERRQILASLGAEIILTPAKQAMDGAIDKAEELSKNPKYFMPDQFSNPANPQAHYETTGPEIWKQTTGQIDIFVSGMGTCGTIMGAGRFLKEKNPHIRIVGVEPDKATPIQGLKNMEVSRVPKILDPARIDERVYVRLEDAMKTARELARKEGIFAGPSSGAAVHAALQYAQSMKKSGTIVVILPDGGMKYLSTGLFG
jgi:cysteine synthase B